MRENIFNLEAAGRVFFFFLAFGNLMKPEARVFETSSLTKKINLVYHLNKFLRFKYVKI